ncbi:MAG TPA: hypothetical protein VL752_19820, partial [Acidisoma sp.]|nr:hypothetical protein [Acidisoma sp.]
LDEDLRAAALTALDMDRTACRRFAEGYSWSAAAAMFLRNLVPMAARRSTIRGLARGRLSLAR